MEAFSLSSLFTSASVDDFLDNFTSKIMNGIDVLAHVRVKLTSSKQKAPWRNAAAVKTQKKECRKAEHKYHTTKLHIHFDTYKERLDFYNLELKRATQSFFSDINKNINNPCTLFATVDRLTNSPAQIAPEFLSTNKFFLL